MMTLDPPILTYKQLKPVTTSVFEGGIKRGLRNISTFLTLRKLQDLSI